MKHKIYILPILATFSLSASAQLNNTVEVTNEVKPVVKDANKINILPNVVETPVKHNNVEYSAGVQPMQNFEYEPLRDYSCDAAYYGNKRGYLQLAGGSHGQLDTKAAYQFDFTNHDVLNIDFTLDGFNGKALNNKHFDIADWESRFYKNRVAGKFNHRFDNGVDFFVKGDVENQVFNYTYTYYSPEQTDKQHNRLADIQAGITPYEIGKLTLSGEAGIKFFHQGYATTFDEKCNESIFNALGTALYNFSDEHCAELGIEIFKSGYGMDEVEGITHLHFTPHYKYISEKVKLQAGIVGGSDGDIAPDLRFTYHINPRSDFYVNAIGYDLDNDFRHLSNIHPYFQFENNAFEEKIVVDAEFHQIDANVGYRFNGKKGFSGDLNLGFDKASTVAEIGALGSTYRGLLYPFIGFCDTQRFYLNLDFTYAYKDKVKIDLKNQFNAWKYKMEDDDEWISGSYTRPLLDLRWKADFKIINNLHAGINWEIAYYSCPDIPHSYERPTTNNIGLSLRYAFPIDLPLSVFVKGDNLLNQKYDRYYGYHNIGANVIAGVAVSF